MDDKPTTVYQDFIPQGEEGGSPYVNGVFQDFVPAPTPTTDVEVPQEAPVTTDVEAPAEQAPVAPGRNTKGAAK